MGLPLPKDHNSRLRVRWRAGSRLEPDPEVIQPEDSDWEDVDADHPLVPPDSSEA